jgi:hypothetical protein
MRPLFLTSIVVFQLVGCAATAPDYQSPSSGPVARIRFATENPGVSVVYQYNDSQCENGEVEVARLRAGPLFKSDNKNLGIPLNTFHVNAAHEVVVQADKQFTGVFEAAQGPDVCKVPFSFLPSAGDFEVLSVVARNSCQVVISEITTNHLGHAIKIGRASCRERVS